jgi:O-antigen/teichoic acid export membrane protein
LIPELHSSEKTSKIARKTTQGLFWNFLAYGSSKGVVLLTTSILARILSKDDFGLVSVAMVGINYLFIVKDLGLGAAIIQRRENFEEAANTVFTVNLIMGTLISLLVLPISPLFATYFDDPQITPVLRLLGTSFFINALGSVHIAKLQRDLDFRRKLIPDFSNAIVKGIISITMAYAGYGVWALVFGQLAGSIVSVILVWILLPWFPTLSINIPLARDLLKFGGSIMGTDAINITTENFDSIIVGRVFGIAKLSIYSLAYRLPEMFLLSNLWVMGSVIFPAFSTIQNQPEQLRKGFLVSIRFIEIIVLPICIGMVIAAHPIILALFGDQWLEAVPVLRILAMYAWINSIGYHVGGIYKAIGRPDILLKLSLVNLMIVIPALLIGSRFGLIGIAFGQLTAMVLRRGISLTVATKLIKLSFVDILRELKPALQGCSLLALATILMLRLTAEINVFVQLTLVVLFGAIIYFCVLWWTERTTFTRLIRLVTGSQ